MDFLLIAKFWARELFLLSPSTCSMATMKEAVESFKQLHFRFDNGDIRISKSEVICLLAGLVGIP